MKLREHKYRAWHPELKQFIYFTPLELRWNKLDGGYHLSGYQEINELFHCFKSEGVRIQQYIGFRDLNQKEIYEGDIVKFENHFTATVIWCEEEAAFQIRTENKGGAFLNEQYMLNFEVVGNIIETPGYPNLII